MNSRHFNMEASTMLASQIKAEALRLGFAVCGIAEAGLVDELHREALSDWLTAGAHGSMAYMNNYTDKRIDPRTLVDHARSVICVALNYYPQQLLRDDQYQFARYAYGKDYHDLMRTKLTALLDALKTLVPEATGRVFCDTAPVLERYWAQKAGIGWIGKHTQLIVPKAGSHFFLGEVITDLALPADQPVENRCGNCRKCIDACPTQALTAPFRLDARRCLSYLTIEHRGDILPEFARHMDNGIYGCDICQTACPWNKFATPTQEEDLQPTEQFLQLTKTDLEQLGEEDFKRIFKGSAVKRTKYSGLKRNIEAGKMNS